MMTNYVKWSLETPDDAPIVVVDDGSEYWDEKWPGPKPDFISPKSPKQSRGVARAKNICLEILMDLDVEHLFLVDDDCYPITPYWWHPYVESPHPHLQAIFPKPGGTSIKKLVPARLDENHISYDGGRGYFLYFHRSAIETVGGFDPSFSPGGWEHVNMSDRIFTAGLTPSRFIDVSTKTIQAMDEVRSIESSIGPRSRADRARARGYRLKMMDVPYYVDYRSAQ
ncbi:glycosyltransferase [Gordonia Phage JonJames]|nr:glycosyltransferase [Gordonia Phage JonJames]